MGAGAASQGVTYTSRVSLYLSMELHPADGCHSIASRTLKARDMRGMRGRSVVRR